MRTLGLKSNIIGTLVLLLTLAIFFSDIVVIMFWQRGLIDAKVQHVRSYLSLWSRLAIGKDAAGKLIAPAELDALCKEAGVGCAGATLIDGQSMVSTTLPKNNADLVRVVRLAAFSGTDVIRFSGASWGVFTFASSTLLIAVPVSGGTSKTAGLGMMIELQPVYQLILGKQNIAFWYMVVNILLLSIVGFFRLHRVVIRPLERLVKVSETYSGAEGQVFFPETRGGEFAHLTMALNGLIFRIEQDRKKLQTTVDSLEIANTRLVETQKEMIRTEKFAAVGRLAAGFAHEIGNPLGIVQGYLELLRQPDIEEEDRRQFSTRAVAELERISRLIHQLLDFSRSSGGKPEPVNVAALLDELIEMVSGQHRMASITFRKRYSNQHTEVIADRDGLRQVFLNCLFNAVDAIMEKGNQEAAEIVVTCDERCEREGETVVRISIEDNGVGIRKDDLEKIFDPFFTTKEPGQGTGLGLSMSYSIIEAAGGKMWVESEYRKGTALTIELPGGKRVV